MRLIDTHCHLYLEDFDPEQDELAQKAKDSGIDTLLLPNVDLRRLTECTIYAIDTQSSLSP